MAEQADAVIIGAGIIGAATAFELCKKGYRTLSVDMNPAAGYGPTSASCAIVRVHYSTLEGTAFAYEGTSTGRTGRTTWASRTSAVSPSSGKPAAS